MNSPLKKKIKTKYFNRKMNENIDTIKKQLEVISSSENDQIPQESSSSSSETSSNSDLQENKIEPLAKRRRKRKRRPKKKRGAAVTAYVPEEPFPARYGNIPAFLNSAAVPKVHLRFDSEGNTDENKSQFNFKPRIIKALLVNLSLCDKVEREIEMDVTQEIPDIAEEIISRKPRIIKAIEFNL